MTSCPICGLGERCRNHWVALQQPDGQIEFQIGAMTASEDNLVLLRNKLKNPPLRELFARLDLPPVWLEEQGRLLAYLPWPLELRGAVHKTLFPNGAPGADNRPLPPTLLHSALLEDLSLGQVSLDLENCLPDELLYRATFRLAFAGLGEATFDYVQLLWAEGMDWSRHLASPAKLIRAQSIVQLLLAGIVDPLRELFAGKSVQVLAEDQPEALRPGLPVDEVAVHSPEEHHLGEEIEAILHHRRLQPVLRDSLLALALAPVSAVH